MAGKLEVRILKTNALMPSSRLVTTFCNFDQVEMNIKTEIQQEISCNIRKQEHEKAPLKQYDVTSTTRELWE